jgi:hypothetical protein
VVLPVKLGGGAIEAVLFRSHWHLPEGVREVQHKGFDGWKLSGFVIKSHEGKQTEHCVVKPRLYDAL